MGATFWKLGAHVPLPWGSMGAPKSPFMPPVPRCAAGSNQGAAYPLPLSITRHCGRRAKSGREIEGSELFSPAPLTGQVPSGVIITPLLETLNLARHRRRIQPWAINGRSTFDMHDLHPHRNQHRQKNPAQWPGVTLAGLPGRHSIIATAVAIRPVATSPGKPGQRPSGQHIGRALDSGDDILSGDSGDSGDTA